MEIAGCSITLLGIRRAIHRIALLITPFLLQCGVKWREFHKMTAV